MIQKITFLLFFINSFLGFSQEPILIHLSEKQNLPDKTFYSIIEDYNGFIWLSANKGLFRYDGKNYKKYTHYNQRGASVFGTKQAKDGKIWCNNITGQFFYVEKNKMQLFIDLKEQLKGELSEFEIHQGYLWVFCSNAIYKINIKRKEVIRVKDNERLDLSSPFSYYNKLYYINKNDVCFIDTTNNQSILLSNKVKYKNSKGETIVNGKSQPFIINDNVCYLQRRHQKNHFFYVDTKTDEIREISGFKKIRKERIYNQYIQQNNLWVATNSGVWIYEIIRNKAILKKHFLKNNHVTKIIKDKEKNYWITTLYNGLFVIPNIFAEKEPITTDDKNIMCVEKINDSVVFFGTDKGKIVKYHLNTKQQEEIVLPTKYEVSNVKYYSKEQQLFISTNDGGFKYNLKTQKLIQYPYFSNVKSSQIVEDKNILYINHNRVNLIKDGDLKKDTLLFAGKRSYTTHYNRLKKQAYIAFVDNLVECDSLWNTRVIEYKNQPIYGKSISQTDDGILWVATFKNELYGLINKKVTQVFTDEKLGSKNIRKIKAEGNNLWVVLDNAIKVLNTQNREIKTLTKVDGILSYDISEMFFIDDKVFFLSSSGLFSLDKHKSFKTPTLELYFNLFQINEKDTLVKQNYQLKHNENTLKIGFNVNGFSYNQKGKYRFRLKGLQDKWFTTEIGENYVKYNSLPSGSYTFEVRPEIGDKLKHKPIRLHFTIKKPFWKSWWFLVLLVCLFTGSIIFYYKRKIKQKEKERLLELEKVTLEKELVNINLTVLRSQMNPHFIFNALNSIQDLVLQQDTNSSYDYIVLFAKLIRNILIYSDKDFIAIEEELDFLKVYLQLENLRFGNEFKYKISFDSEESLEVPSLLIQPFIENALIHGLMHKKGNKTLTVFFRFKDELLTCEITDNGIGREKSKLIRNRQGNHHKSFALEAIEKRLKILKKQLNINIGYQIIDLYCNKKAAGTKVIINIPYKRKI